jgi:CSLREA domain-containing protein
MLGLRPSCSKKRPAVRRIGKSLRVEALEDKRLLTVITVNSFADNTTTDGFITLREAILAANADLAVGDAPAGNGTDTIRFSQSVFNVLRTIDIALGGQFEISEALMIEGPGKDLLTIDGNDASRLFLISDGDAQTSQEVIVKDLTLKRGRIDGPGGAILNHESLHLESAQVLDSTTTIERDVNGIPLNTGDGGGIASWGSLFLDNVIVAGNTAGLDLSPDPFEIPPQLKSPGGGIAIYLGPEEVLAIEDSLLAENRAGVGGGLFAENDQNIAAIDYESTISLTAVEILNTQITSNVASVSSGGFSVSIHTGEVLMEQSVISFNTAVLRGNGGGRLNVGVNLAIDPVDSTGFTASALFDRLAVHGNRGDAFSPDIDHHDLFGGGGLDLVTRGPLTISNSTIAGNKSLFFGGIRHNDEGTAARQATGGYPLEIVNSTISNNTAESFGAGTFEGVMRHCTVTDNVARIFNDTEFQGYRDDSNFARFDGGLFGGGGLRGRPAQDFELENSIVAGNHQRVLGSVLFGGTTWNIQDLILLGGQSFDAPDLFFFGSDLELEAIDDPDYCLIGSNIGTNFSSAYAANSHGSLIGGAVPIDPRLMPLHDNGGFILPDGTHIFTHRPECMSPAVDAGDPVFSSSNLPTYAGVVYGSDERGPSNRPRVYDVQDIDNGGLIDMGAFELSPPNLASLAADFDDDGDVDSVDLTIWRNNFGLRTATSADGDADGDGDVDAMDLDVWRLQFGANTPTSGKDADFNNDGLITATDFLIWQQHLGLTTAANGDGDADGDGDVDGNDFLIWQRELGMVLDQNCAHWIENMFVLDNFLDLTLLGKIVVSTLEDENDGDYSLGDLSLREALVIANSLTGADEIVFANHLAGTITLSGTSLWVTSSVEIIGPGADLLTIDANGATGTGGAGQVFAVNNGNSTLIDVTIRGLTVTGGDLSHTFEGSGIYSVENLTLDGVAVVGNVGGRSGGGLYHGGTGGLTILNSTFDENSAAWGGGAVVATTGSISIKSSTFSNNDAVTVSGMSGSGIGGGLYLKNNSSGDVAKIANSTFSGNDAEAHAGAIIVDNAYAVLVNDTIAFNDGAGTTGGVWRYSGGLTLHNTIVAKNTIGGTTNSDVAGTLVASSSYNLFGAGVNGQTLTGSGNQIGSPSLPGLIDPKLETLANNGGPTKTHRLQTDSPALDAADITNAAFAGLAADQRGFNRIVYLPGASGTYVDVGAYEYGLIVTSNSAALNTTFSRNSLTLRDALSISATITTATVDQIEFASALGTITLSGTSLWVTSSVEIIGPGADLLTIDANGATGAGGTGQVFAVNNGNSTLLDVTIRGLTVTGGDQSHAFEGSGIYSLENLTLDEVVVTGNVGGRSGGGLYHAGTGNLTILNSTFDNNSAAWGGGAAVNTTGSVTISGSTFSNNDAVTVSTLGGSGGGAGLYLQNNSSGNPAKITNSTFSGNVAESWVGGIVVDNAYAVLTNNTIAFNDGGGTTGGVWRYSGGLTLHNTIVAKNTIGGTTNSDVAGTLVASSSYNLFGAGVNGQTLTGSGNQIGSPSLPGLIDPKLDPLADNGGPTKTHRLQDDSTAIDAGSNLIALDLVFDQRGHNRLADGYPDDLTVADIGAFELSVDEYFRILPFWVA